MSAKTLAQIALITAVMCVLGPLSIPIGPVPISLTPLAVFLGVYILGMKKGTLAYLIYLLIGFAGAPVLSGCTGGAAKLLGPTGGYLFGFILMALIAGFFIDKFYSKIYLQVIGMFLGLVVCYLFGTLWLAHEAGMSLSAAAAAGVWPFVALDCIKIAVSVALGRAVRSGLERAGLLEAAH